jgi:hypothetical protein
MTNLFGNRHTASIWQNIATKTKMRFSGVQLAINGFKIRANTNLPTNIESIAIDLQLRKTSLPGNLKRKVAERPSSKAQTSG